MKKTLTILLIAIFTVPFWGAYVYLQSQLILNRKEVKKQILAGLDRDETVLLKFSLMDSQTLLDWKDAGEFCYNGQMYDVIGSELTGDSIAYRCYPDHREPRLKKEIGRAMAKAGGHDPIRKSQNERFTDFLKIVYLQGSDIWKTADLKAFNLQLSILIFQYSSPAFSPPSPPPKLS